MLLPCWGHTDWRRLGSCCQLQNVFNQTMSIDAINNLRHQPTNRINDLACFRRFRSQENSFTECMTMSYPSMWCGHLRSDKSRCFRPYIKGAQETRVWTHDWTTNFVQCREWNMKRFDDNLQAMDISYGCWWRVVDIVVVLKCWVELALTVEADEDY